VALTRNFICRRISTFPVVERITMTSAAKGFPFRFETPSSKYLLAGLHYIKLVKNLVLSLKSFKMGVLKDNSIAF